MAKQPADDILRHASPSERRMIARENLGFYHGILVGAVYEFPADGLDLRSARSFAGPLRRCVEQLPWLSVVVRNPGDEKKAGYAPVRTVNVEEHVVFLEGGGDHIDDDDESRWLEARLQPLLDGQWPADRPPWHIAVCPLPSRHGATPTSRCLVAFVFCHSIGDGLCGNIFHRLFLDALRQGAGAASGAEDVSMTLIEVPQRSLPEPFDTPARLPISWSFLLPPLLAVLLPKFLADWLGIRPHASTVDEGTWTGRSAFFDLPTHRSRLRIVEIPAPLVARAARVSRAHDTKMTGTIHQLVVRALSDHICDSAVTNFVSGTAVSMRPSVGATVGEWGNFASGCYGVHPRVDTSEPVGEYMWNSARAITRSLAESATKREDQPLGLLRYAPSIRGWLQGKLGSRRDSSYEVSNLGVLDVADDEAQKQQQQQQTGYTITKVIFAQPGNALHAPLDVNVDTVKGGPMIIAVTWQEGALGVSGDEAAIVDGICASLRAGFEGLQE